MVEADLNAKQRPLRRPSAQLRGPRYAGAS